MEAAHLTIQQRARRVLRRYWEIRPLITKAGEPAKRRLPTSELDIYHRGSLLEAFLSQWFFVAEPYSGHPGSFASLADTLDSVRRILDGQVQAVTPDDVKYVDAFHLAKA